MSFIITATDFSDISFKAVNYACQLASDTGASVTIIHTFMIPVAFSDTPVPTIPLDEMQEDAETRMEELRNKTQQLFPNVEITANVMYGTLVECLSECTEIKKPWLVVLGNNKDETPLIGGHTLRVLRNMEYPVAAISPETVYKPVKNICLACDYKKVSDSFPATQILEIVSKTKATLHVLNVAGADGVQEETVTGTERLHNYLTAARPQYHFMNEADIDSTIVSFVEKHQMDWLMIIPHKYSFFESLFHKSHTKSMAQLSDLPLIALHEGD